MISSRPTPLDVAMACTLCLAIALAPGCGRSNRLPTYPLTVHVAYGTGEGKPLEGATVVFRSTEHKVTATGATKADGACVLSTFVPGDGVVAGNHQASVVMQTPPGDPDEVKRPITVPVRLSDPATSGLEFSITSDGPSTIRILIPPN